MSNPYQTPTGQLQTDDDQAFGEIGFFNPASRINRLRYWAHGFLVALAFYAIIAVAALLSYSVSPMIGVPIIAAAYIALIVFSFILVIQRLHDLNKSGWMSLLMLVPFANIYLAVLIIFFKGTPGRNNYGLQTPPNKTWHWIVGLAMPILFTVGLIGVLAAIGIPAYNDYVERSQAYQEDTYNSEGSSDNEYYYEEQTTDDAEAAAEATGSEYYESDTATEVESMMEEETTEESSAP